MEACLAFGQRRLDPPALGNVDEEPVLYQGSVWHLSRCRGETAPADLAVPRKHEARFQLAEREVSEGGRLDGGEDGPVYGRDGPIERRRILRTTAGRRSIPRNVQHGWP